MADVEVSAIAVTIRLGRRQTPYRYIELATLERDMRAAQVRAEQLRRDADKAGRDAAKMVEGYARLKEIQAARAERERAGRRAREGGATPRQDDDGA